MSCFPACSITFQRFWNSLRNSLTRSSMPWTDSIRRSGGDLGISLWLHREAEAPCSGAWQFRKFHWGWNVLKRWHLHLGLARSQAGTQRTSLGDFGFFSHQDICRRDRLLGMKSCSCGMSRVRLKQIARRRLTNSVQLVLARAKCMINTIQLLKGN